MKKVYCSECKHFERNASLSESRCLAPANMRLLNNPIEKCYEPIYKAAIKNQNNDCKDFRSTIKQERNFKIWLRQLLEMVKEHPEYISYFAMGIILLCLLVALIKPVMSLLTRYG